MKLTKFRVTNFRSVKDSGWIEFDKVAALIGTNESGKTNLLLPLWKFNPAKEGQINAIADYPRKHYNTFRADKEKPVFISTYFELEEELKEKLTKLTHLQLLNFNAVIVKKDFDGNFSIEFPFLNLKREEKKQKIEEILQSIKSSVETTKKLEGDIKLQQQISDHINTLINNTEIFYSELLGASQINAIIDSLASLDVSKFPKNSQITPILNQNIEEVKTILESITIGNPTDNREVQELIVSRLPKFVYYSNYGNLDSEIYLPHVIENLSRENLGTHEEAKARTLKVLFEFVRLSPQEILELGKDLKRDQGEPTDQEIHAISEKKKERDILLQSAGTELTDKFRDWWKQGQYRFRFQADGDHFKIWVSDDKRPEDIELEGRSSGLQWFLSFYLIFLVESKDSHANAILLLDEPGLSLHPIAQRDLSKFFENLAKTNQIIYTTHSPFLVDPDQLDRVKAVYIDDDGTTAVSSDLRITEDKKEQSHSIYPVYAALGLSISDTLLQGCQSIIVEGQSDLIYLSAIKNFLINKGLITPKREMVFIPSGGVKGIKANVSILTGKNESLPYVIVDSDKIGNDLAVNIRSNFYAKEKEKIIQVHEIINLQDSEVEDLLPFDILISVVTRYLRGRNKDFSEVVKKGVPIISQIEEYAKLEDLTLEDGWKVEIAKRFKQKLENDIESITIDSELINNWETLFTKLVTQ